MNATLKFAAAALCGMLLGIPAVQADEDFPSTSLYIELGTTEGEYLAFPHDLNLQVGELYRLVITNPSPDLHLLIAPEFGDTVLTTGASRRPARGDLRYASMESGIAVRPGEMVELYFVPFKEGRYKLFCEERTHTAGGMEISVDVTL